MPFDEETARARLRDWLEDPASREVPGFPHGDPEHILELSDPPWFTACPNPFVAGFLEGLPPRDLGSREAIGPWEGALVAGERHPVYRFHPYHTKVPPEIIRAMIEHYTRPGDVVLDGFSGSGMTGVAAREAGRYAIAVDLCPVAGFVSAVNGSSHDIEAAVSALERCVAESRERHGGLYRTREGDRTLAVNYFVWSDVFRCPACRFEFPFFPHGVVHHGNRVQTRKAFDCPGDGCEAALSVRRITRVIRPDGVKERALVWVNAGIGRERISRPPTLGDLELAREASTAQAPAWVPRDPIDPDGYSARLAQLGQKRISDVSRLLSDRNLLVFADLWERVGRLGDVGLRNVCRATLTSIFTVISERQGYFGGGGGMSGNLYMPIVRMEKNVYDTLRRKIGKLRKAEATRSHPGTRVLVSTQSTTELSSFPDESIDYIDTDPPFGANIIYSEMNLLLEGWLRVRTNEGPEAVIDRSRDRGFDDSPRVGIELGEATPDDVWAVVGRALEELPEVSAGRTRHLLFDRILARCVEAGRRVPISAPDFYRGLHARYACRDGMYFLP